MLKDDSKSKLPIPLHLSCKLFVQYRARTIVSMKIIERFYLQFAYSNPIGFEASCGIRDGLKAKTSFNQTAEGWADTEHGPIKFVGARDGLNEQRLAEAIYHQFMESFVKEHGKSLMRTFDWGNRTELQLYRLTKDLIFHTLNGRYLKHMSDYRDDPENMCGNVTMMDGLCQLIRTTCAHEGPPDKTHAWDVYGVRCSRSVCKLTGSRRFSRYCVEHKLGNEEAEQEELEKYDASILANTRAKRVQGEIQTLISFDKVNKILCQVANPGGQGRAFAVTWSDMEETDVTREFESSLKNTKVLVRLRDFTLLRLKSTFAFDFFAVVFAFDFFAFIFAFDFYCALPPWRNGTKLIMKMRKCTPCSTGWTRMGK